MCLAASPLQAQKTDHVILTNGDDITGEVKGLSKGKLEYSTDDAGTLSIKWEKVLQVTSSAFFEVEVGSGRKYFGTLQPASEPGKVVVELTGLASDTLDIPYVVTITPIETRFLDRLKGYVDLGFTVTRADNQVELSLAGDVRYRGRKYTGSYSFTGFYRDNVSGKTTRTSTSFTFGRFVAAKWILGALATAEQNSELNLDHRLQLGVNAIRSLIHTNEVLFGATAGPLVGSEKFGNEPASFTLEIYAGLGLEAFRFDTPKLDLTSSLAAIPSLSDLGRVRVNFDARFRYEVLKDFFAGVRGFLYYDSRPPDPTAPNVDYSVVFTLGWEFK